LLYLCLFIQLIYSGVLIWSCSTNCTLASFQPYVCILFGGTWPFITIVHLLVT